LSRGFSEGTRRVGSLAAFDRLKAAMGERLQPLRCGDVFEF